MNYKNIFAVVLVLFSLHSFAQNTISCIEIDAILINACSPEEGLNEQVLFTTGNTPLSLTDLQVTWPNTSNTWLGTCQNANTASLVAQMDATVGSCGTLLEPSNGVIPANQQVLLFSGISPTVSNLSFAGLSDTLYVIFHCGTTTTGNFANSGANLRTLILSNASGCADTVSYIPNQAPAQDGAAALFNSEGVVTYNSVGCSFFYNPLSATWTAPTSLCSSAQPINLYTLVTGSPLGYFTGLGVEDGFFNPAGLSENAVISYVVGSGSCLIENQQTIVVQQSGNPSWTAPASICSGAEPIDLAALVTGSVGGIFSGSGVTGTIFNPQGLSGNVVVTYQVGSGSCLVESQQTINVLPGGDPSWNSPGNLCNPTNPITLSDLVTGTPGGTWSGLGVAGSIFFPDGLSGPIQITYSVGSGQCASQLAQTITIISSVNAPIVPASLTFCQGQVASPIDAGVLPGANVTWFSDAALSTIIFQGNGFLPPANISATYYVTQNIASCASSASSIAVSFEPAPAPPVTQTAVVFCTGQAIPLLSASASGIINWYNDAGLTQILATGTSYQPDNSVGNDIFVQTVEGNCASEAIEITLTEAAPVSAEILYEGNTAFCDFQPIVLNSASPSGNLWSTGETMQSITITEAGTYTLTVTGTCNSDNAVQTFVDNGVDASFSLSVSEGLAPLTTTASITSSNADVSTFSLSGDNQIVTDNLPFTIQNEGTYTLTLISSNDEGCIDSVSREITVISGVLEVSIPNSFTPNGDGFNDAFKPVIKGLEEINLVIFNRYGNQVASWKQEIVNWDGSHNGTSSPDGVYFYVLMGKDYSGAEVERTGSITILR